MTKHKHADLIHANLHRFHYTANGILYWADGTRRGKKAGWLDSSGYLQVKIGNVCVLVHRIIWVMHHGSYPDQIDHINHDRTDNRIINLRASNNTKNQHNASKRKDNTSGHTGVTVRDWKYQVRISVNGERKHLGTFNNMKDAVAAYEKAKGEYHAYTA